MTKLSLILIILVILPGCYPDLIRLNEMVGGTRIGAKILTDLNSVEKTSDNGVKMHPGSRLAMKVIGMTQHETDFTVQLLNGSGIKFAFRTVEFNYENNSSLILDLSKQGIKLTDENGKIISENNSVQLMTGKKYRLRCVNKANNIKVFLDCDEIFDEQTDLPASEYVFLETYYDSTVEITGIDIVSSFEE